MVQKKIDSRIKKLIECCADQNHRSLFVLIGDKGKDQVVHLHYMLSKATHARPNVLWCYKKELGFTSHRQKRMKQIKKAMQKGLIDPEKDDPFELFISSTDIRYTYYKETDKILGNTFGMCILQDFEAITPNLLARTIETVQGGGIVVLLLSSLTSLKQLHTMSMDVHARYRTNGNDDVVGRFNERFLLSLTQCQTCIMLDDNWNVLPFSKHVKNLGKSSSYPSRLNDDDDDDDNDLDGDDYQGGNNDEGNTKGKERKKELAEMVESMADVQPAGSLISVARTRDQAQALLTFLDVLSGGGMGPSDNSGKEKGSGMAPAALRTTVSVTASRGRGKSASLGLAIAAAIAYGYSNIFLTAPSPENVKTLFQFVVKGLEKLGYEEHLDFDLVESTHASLNKSIVRINVHRSHRQTIQFIEPKDSQVLGQAELVVVDEAAAIPLPIVKKLLGPYLVFLSSTIHGYEGTGRSLSLKLLSQLREHSAASAKAGKDAFSSSSFREVRLEDPIRYGNNDPVESWLNKLLCLDVNALNSSNSLSSSIKGALPHPQECELFYVQRDTLFSHHRASEVFLQRMVSLFVSSHYRNSPNDLQLMSDAPAHHLFVLLPPPSAIKRSDTESSIESQLPEILCVVQVCLEGDISREIMLKSLSRGIKSAGDLIPWTVSQQFQEKDFSSMSGVRVVRIATHPDFQKMGYGARALQLLQSYYSGEITSIDGSYLAAGSEKSSKPESQISGSVLEELELSGPLKPRTVGLPPLLMKLSEVPAPRKLHWLGVSFGLTQQLLKFWRRSGYKPVYLRQTANDLTAEHTCIMLMELSGNGVLANELDENWLSPFVDDFRKRLISFISYSQFQTKFPASLVLGLLEEQQQQQQVRKDSSRIIKSLETFYASMSLYDLRRLGSYANNMVDFHLITDLIPVMADHFFLQKLPDLTTRTSYRSDAVEGTAKEEAPLKEIINQVSLSPVQKCILLGMGCQRKSVDQISIELNLPVSQVLAMLVKVVRKFSQYYDSLVLKLSGAKEESSISSLAIAMVENIEKDDPKWDPVATSLDDELKSASAVVLGQQAKAKVENLRLLAKETQDNRKDEENDDEENDDENEENDDENGNDEDPEIALKRAMINDLDFERYAVAGDDEAWDQALSARKQDSKTLLTVLQQNNENSSNKKRKWTPGVAEKEKQIMLESKKKKKSSRTKK